MNNLEIQEQLENSRERLLVALEPLPDEALLQAGAINDWSVADLLVHLTVWESELVTALKQLKEGKKPTRLLEAMAQVDAYNAARYAENKGRDLDRVFDDLQGVRVQLEGWLEEFSERELTDANRHRWFDGKPLWRIIEVNSFGHELEHLPELEALVARWQVEGSG